MFSCERAHAHASFRVSTRVGASSQRCRTACARARGSLRRSVAHSSSGRSLWARRSFVPPAEEEAVPGGSVFAGEAGEPGYALVGPGAAAAATASAQVKTSTAPTSTTRWCISRYSPRSSCLSSRAFDRQPFSDRCTSVADGEQLASPGLAARAGLSLNRHPL